MTAETSPDSSGNARLGTVRTATQRMLTILWMLRNSPDKTLQSYEIWDAISEYQGGAANSRRLYRYDIELLTARGLIHARKSTRPSWRSLSMWRTRSSSSSTVGIVRSLPTSSRARESQHTRSLLLRDTRPWKLGANRVGRLKPQVWRAARDRFG